MACEQAFQPYIPPGTWRWSEDICEQAGFGVEQVEGDTVPISLAPCRAGGIRCAHHGGHVSIAPTGDKVRWYCAARPQGRTFLTLMTTGLLRGDAVGVGAHETPRWTELRFYSQDRHCEPPIV